jgi:hypothetical protein
MTGLVGVERNESVRTNRLGGVRLERGGFALMVAFGLSGACGPAPAPAVEAALWSPPPAAVRLDARVSFTGTQFVIENRSDRMWRAVAVSVARRGDPPPYTYRADAILGGRSLTIGALNFARPDDLRLNPFRLQPDRWAVVATLDDGRTGFAEGTLE